MKRGRFDLSYVKENSTTKVHVRADFRGVANERVSLMFVYVRDIGARGERVKLTEVYDLRVPRYTSEDGLMEQRTTDRRGEVLARACAEQWFRKHPIERDRVRGRLVLRTGQNGKSTSRPPYFSKVLRAA